MADLGVSEACRRCNRVFQHDDPIVYMRSATFRAMRDAGRRELIGQHYTWVPNLVPCTPTPVFHGSRKGRAICLVCATTLEVAQLL